MTNDSDKQEELINVLRNSDDRVSAIWLFTCVASGSFGIIWVVEFFSDVQYFRLSADAGLAALALFLVASVGYSHKLPPRNRC